MDDQGRVAVPSLLSDIVPSLRGEVVITARPEAAGLFDAGVQGSERVFTLYDIEVSVARMLDGRRSAAELIEAAGRLGIPVSLESLGKYIRQLDAYGFIAASTLGEGETGAAWTPRAQWGPEVRELFESALRTYRMGRYAVSAEYLEAMLQIEPEVPEATSLLARIGERLAAGEDAVPPPSFEELHPPGAQQQLEDAQPQLLGEPLGLSTSAPTVPVPVHVPPRAQARALPWPALAAGAAFVAVLAVLALPLRDQVSAPVEVSPAREPSPAQSPAEGKVGELLVQPGEWVEAGTLLARVEVGELASRKAALEQALEKVERALERAQEKASSATARKLEATLQKKEEELLRLQALPQRPKGRAALRRKQVEVARARKAHQAVVREAHRFSLGARREELVQEVAALVEALAQTVVRASADGSFEPLRREGDPVAAGEPLGLLVDVRTLVGQVALTSGQAARVKPGQKVRVRLTAEGSPEVASEVVSVEERQGAGRLWYARLELPNPERRLPARGAGIAQIDCGRRALLSHLMAALGLD